MHHRATFQSVDSTPPPFGLLTTKKPIPIRVKGDEKFYMSLPVQLFQESLHQSITAFFYQKVLAQKIEKRKHLLLGYRKHVRSKCLIWHTKHCSWMFYLRHTQARWFTVAALPLICTKIICISKLLEVVYFYNKSIINSFTTSFKIFLKVGKYACLFHQNLLHKSQFYQTF